jgi:hypothetical protein
MGPAKIGSQTELWLVISTITISSCNDEKEE